MPRLSSRQAMAATGTGLLFVAWATGSKLWFVDSSWGFGLHTMMVGVIGTLLIVATSYVLQLMSRD
jgi:SSS family solute:Na+ symporter